jgi:hypothetical protein
LVSWSSWPRMGACRVCLLRDSRDRPSSARCAGRRLKLCRRRRHDREGERGAHHAGLSREGRAWEASRGRDTSARDRVANAQPQRSSGAKKRGTSTAEDISPLRFSCEVAKTKMYNKRNVVPLRTHLTRPAARLTSSGFTFLVTGSQASSSDATVRARRDGKGTTDLGTSA